MRILLINPPRRTFLRTVLPRYVEEEAGFYPPLGLAYVAAALRRAGFAEVAVLDCVAEGLDEARLKARIAAFKPGIAGITATTFTLPDVLWTAALVKSVDSSVHVTVGGPHTSVYPVETVSQCDVDTVVVGEGEATFPELALRLEKGLSPEGVAGVHYKKDGVPAANPPRDPVADLDALPFPARDLLPLDKYYSIHGEKRRMTTAMSTRGCPFNCTFCYHAFGRRIRYRSPENIVEEVREIAAGGITEVFFFDDIFTVSQDFVLRFCELMKKADTGVVWEIRARVDTVTEPMLKALSEAGCRRISYGVESGTERVLKVLNKGITLEQARRAFALSKAYGFTTYADFMIGAPTETKEEILETIAFARSLKADYAQFSAIIPYPNTELYRAGLRNGTYGTDVWREFAASPSPDFVPPVASDTLTFEELSSLLDTAYRRFYLTPGFVLKSLLRAGSPGRVLQLARAAFRLVTGK